MGRLGRTQLSVCLGFMSANRSAGNDVAEYYKQTMELAAHWSFANLASDTGTAAVALLFTDELRLRFINFNSHRLYLNAILGFGSGVSLALLVALSLAQVVSCLVLVVPTLYNKLGTAVPSVALGSTLALEMLLYRGFNDRELTYKAVMLETALFLIGIFRNRRKAVNRAVGVPVYGRSLAVEAHIRKACTKMRVGILFPPLCFVVCLRVVVKHRFWSYTGTAFEINRTSFCTGVAQSAVMMLLSSQDKSPTIDILNKTQSAFRVHIFNRCYKAVWGVVPDGRKKRL